MGENYHNEEAFYHFTMMDFIELVEHYGDRVWEELEKHSPAVYESFCAYKANQEIEEFLSNQSEMRWKDDCDTFGSKITNCSVDTLDRDQRDYWKDETND